MLGLASLLCLNKKKNLLSNVSLWACCISSVILTVASIWKHFIVQIQINRKSLFIMVCTCNQIVLSCSDTRKGHICKTTGWFWIDLLGVKSHWLLSVGHYWMVWRGKSSLSITVRLPSQQALCVLMIKNKLSERKVKWLCRGRCSHCLPGAAHLLEPAKAVGYYRQSPSVQPCQLSQLWRSGGGWLPWLCSALLCPFPIPH